MIQPRGIDNAFKHEKKKKKDHLGLGKDTRQYNLTDVCLSRGEGVPQE